MKVADFDFDLPPALIATRPAEPRDSARLLQVGARLEDRLVSDLPALLQAGDLLVVNDTRVIPARLDGLRGAARIELTLHKQEAPDRWRAFARPARRLAPGRPDRARRRLRRRSGGEGRGRRGDARLRPRRAPT
jgi:S-adenosylmethionine:tRNA ribosyltransferase-isomerase